MYAQLQISRWAALLLCSQNRALTCRQLIVHGRQLVVHLCKTRPQLGVALPAGLDEGSVRRW